MNNYNLYYLSSNIDNKFYIGVTNNPDRRYYEHINYTTEETHHNGNWIRKILRNGGEIMLNVVYKKLTKKEAIKMEIFLIDSFKKIYPNRITNTAQGGMGFNHKGVPHSEEHKKSLEKAQPHKVRIPKDVLIDLYINQKLSKKKIGDMYGCGPTTIDRRLVEYNIQPRTTPNYKVSYKLDCEKVIDMFVNKGMSITSISEEFEIGMTGIRSLLIRKGIDTSMNKRKKKYDEELLDIKYLELYEIGLPKMVIYEKLSEEFNISKEYISKLLGDKNKNNRGKLIIM